MTTTLADLFEMGICAERSAEALYTIFAQRFAQEPDLAKFWQHYAEEEAYHAKSLEDIRDRLPAEKLSAPADPATLVKAQAALKFLDSAHPLEIRDLEDAFQLANEAETSEVIAVFNFLAENFAHDRQTRSMLTQQLRHHINDITFNFPKRFASRGARLATLAK